jgi:hypothetical protein
MNTIRGPPYTCDMCGIQFRSDPMFLSIGYEDPTKPRVVCKYCYMHRSKDVR